MGKLDGKSAIVTGAASGIGEATAIALAAEGAQVVVADLNPDGAKRVAEAIGEARAQACVVDVSDEDQVRAMVRCAVERFGGLDVLHNNAAASEPDVMTHDADLVDLDLAVWERAMAVNARGPMLGCKHAIPEMLERGGGSIINTSSVAGLVGDTIRAAYASSKGAVNTLTLSVATMYGKRGIRCNAICPGVIETPSLAANVPPAEVEVYRDNVLAPRLGRAEDIARMVVFLASDDSEYMTGQIVRVDGGTLSHHPSYAGINRLRDP